MIDVSFIFTLIGVVIFIGFIGSLLFLKTKIPDILILLFVGFIIGPIFTWYFGHSLIPNQQALLNMFTPFFAALALMIILFDGGLGLNFDKVIGQMGPSFFIGVGTQITSIVTTAIITFFVFNDILIALIMGAIVAGTSGTIVVSLVQRMNVSEETKTVLTIESVVTDVLIAVIVIILIEFKLSGSGNYLVAAQSLISAFAIAVFIGLLFGILWLKTLTFFYGKPYAFMTTLAALFLLYTIVEILHGSGAMAALVFGFVLSNDKEIARMFKMKSSFVFDEKIKQFQGEITFFVRTFFFVYLGAMFVLPNPSDEFFIIFLLSTLMIVLAMVAGRYAITFLAIRRYSVLKKDSTAIWTMMPRGLAAAVLATLAVSRLVDLPDITKTLIINYSFMVIVLTCIVATIGTFISERKNRETKSVPLNQIEKPLQKN